MSKSSDLLAGASSKYHSDGRKNLTYGFDGRPVYLPATSNAYVRMVSGYTQNLEGPRKGQLPSFLKHGYDSLNFLDQDKGDFTLTHSLFSAGHATLDLTKLHVEKMIQERDRDRTWMLGDSGGYQIASGILNYDWANYTVFKPSDVRVKLLNYLEHTADYSLILDIPTRAIDNEKATNITTFGDCLKHTLENNKYFLANRQFKTKFLNCLQGRSVDECDMWYDNVKHFNFEGWAFGGHQNLAMELLMRRLIKLRDDNLFSENEDGQKRNWLHFLGQSRLPQICLYNTAQKYLREQTGDDELQMSYDSASAFLMTANGSYYTGGNFSTKKMNFIASNGPDNKAFVGSKDSFKDEINRTRVHGNFDPKSTAWEDIMNLGDTCVKDDTYECKTSWDSMTYTLLMGQGLETQIEVMHEMNRIYELPIEEARDLMPENIIRMREEVLPEIFTSETPYDVIEKNRKLLNELTGRRMDIKEPMNVSHLFG